MPRIPLVTRQDLPESQRHIYDDIAKRRGWTVVANEFALLLNSPQAAARVSDLGYYLRFEAGISKASRELVILVVAREFDSDYLRVHHELRAREAGLSEATIEAIREHRTTEGLGPSEASAVCYTEELLSGTEVSDDTFNSVLKQFGNAGLVDLTLTVGYYVMLSFVAKAMRIDLEPGL